MSKTMVIVMVGILVVVGIFMYRTFTAPICLDGDINAINTMTEPVQNPEYLKKIPSVKYGSALFDFQIVASYKLSGTIISTREYPTGFGHQLAPWDFAVVWGQTERFVPYATFAQHSRFCTYEYQLGTPIDLEYMKNHLSNNHIIPANKNIKKALPLVKEKDKIEIDGYLVNVIGSMPKHLTSHWNTSKIRTDTGDGACEIIYVTHLQVNDKIYE